MNVHELISVIVVMALVVTAAVLSTPKGKLPLAVRGLAKLMKRDGRAADVPKIEPVPVYRKLIAFVLVIIALLIACA